MSPVRSVRITKDKSGERRYVKITRIYTGEDGNGHFEDLWFPITERLGHPCPTLEEGRSVGYVGEMPALGVMFKNTPPGGDHPAHWSPGRTLHFTLVGVLELDLGDGEVRRFGPGDIFLLDEHEHGRGHISNEIEPRLTAIAMLDPDMDLAPYREVPT